MSSKLGKLASRKAVAITVRINLIEVTGKGVIEKDMFVIDWTMKGLRGREKTGTTDNVRAVIDKDEGDMLPVARFKDVLEGDVQVKPRKDGNGYEPMEFQMMISHPALHKKDASPVGKAVMNVFNNVPILTSGQLTPAEQTIFILKDQSVYARCELSFQFKGDTIVEDLTESESLSPVGEPDNMFLVKTPPATPQKEETPAEEPKKHKHRHSTTGEPRKKEADDDEKKKLLAQIEELKKRIKELEEALAESERQRKQDKDEADKKIAELTEALAAAQRLSGASDDEKDKELAQLRKQIADLKADLGKKSDGAAPPAESNMTMLIILAIIAAIVGIIIGRSSK